MAGLHRTIGLICGGLLALTASVGATEGDGRADAMRVLETHYGASQISPLIESHVERKVGATGEQERILKAVRARLPAFHDVAATTIISIIPPEHLGQVAAFSASKTGRKVALADLRWVEEVRDQATVCLADQATHLKSLHKDRSKAIALAAKLVMGDCASLREAKAELKSALSPDLVKRARAYVELGGVRPQAIRHIARSSAEAAAESLIAATVAQPKEHSTITDLILNAVVLDENAWREAATLHYAAALQADDLNVLAGFIASDPGAHFVNNRPRIDVAIAKAAELWVADSIQAALDGGGSAAASAATSAVTAISGPTFGSLPAAQPRLSVKPNLASPGLGVKSNNTMAQ